MTELDNLLRRNLEVLTDRPVDVGLELDIRPLESWSTADLTLLGRLLDAEVQRRATEYRGQYDCYC